jgi:hypothetical protein
LAMTMSILPNAFLASENNLWMSATLLTSACT